MPSALVIQLRQFGDALLTEPAVRLLSQRGYSVDVLTETVGDWVFKGSPHVRKIYLWDKKKNQPKSMLGLIKQLRAQRYELLFDFQALPKTLGLSYLLGAKKRLGMTQSMRRYFYQEHCFPDGTYPALQKTKCVAKGLGLVEGDFSEETLPEIHLNAREQEKSSAYFHEVKKNAGRRKVLLFCPVSRQPYKVPDPVLSAKICQTLQKQGYYLLPVFGPGQKDQVGAVNLHLGGNKIDMIANRLSLREWLGVMQNCSGYIGVDGGHKHLAIAAGVPVFTLYHNVPPFWHPPGLRSHAFVDLTPKTGEPPTETQVIQPVLDFLDVSVKGAS